MTVCIAALFRWNYGPPDKPDIGVAAITASDKMITFGDHEYEPDQQKVAYITPHTLLLIAGEYPLHSEALKRTQEQVRNSPSAKPYNIATIYGQAIQSINAKRAEDLFLAPLGLNTDSFLAQQKEMSDRFVASITEQLQNYSGADVEALVVGIEDGHANIYKIDRYGTVSSYNDVGFAAIGIGAAHASSLMMQVGYTKHHYLSYALVNTYFSKKVSEVAPGVGSGTDVHLVFRTGIQQLWPELRQTVEARYEKYALDRGSLIADAINRVDDSLNETKEPPQPEEVPPPTGSGEDSVGSSEAEGRSSSEGTEDKA